MNPLDKLYGKGTTKAMKSAYGDPSLEQTDTEDGVRVYLEWSDGSSAKIDCAERSIYYQSLISKTPGLYTKLWEDVPQFWRDCGVATIVATPFDDKAESILLKRGNFKRKGSRLEAEL